MIKQYKEKDVMEFLKESNAIEGVYDKDSLKQAKKAWDFLVTCPTLKELNILVVHRILMINSTLKPTEKGAFRTCPVYIGGREGIEWSKIPKEIEHWNMNANDLIENGKKEAKIFLERLTKEQHVKYEKIHPFVDGNGRTGRMLMNWTRLQVGLPILIIKADERWKYYEWFQD